MPRKNVLTYAALAECWPLTRQRIHQIQNELGVACLLDPEKLWLALQSQKASRLRTHLADPDYRMKLAERLAMATAIAEAQAELFALRRKLRNHRLRAKP